MAQESWMNHPGLKNIDPVKLELLKNLASQSQGKKQSEMAPLIMAAVSQANSKGISFSPDEMGLLVEIMKTGRSPKEQAQMDQMIKMASTLMKNKK